MKYYTPRSLAYFSILVSVVSSAAFPLFALLFTEIVFLIMVGNQNPNYVEDRNAVCL